MELYYKVPKDSKTGKSFLSIIERLETFHKKAIAVAKKYGIKEMYNIGWQLCGVYTCHFEKQPDRKDWKKVDDGYMPKVRSKNKELLKDFDELKKLSIERSEIDELIGNDNPFHQVGYHIFDDCIIFITDDKHDIKCKDTHMISNIEYMQLKERESQKLN